MHQLEEAHKFLTVDQFDAKVFQNPEVKEKLNINEINSLQKAISITPNINQKISKLNSNLLRSEDNVENIRQGISKSY